MYFPKSQIKPNLYTNGGEYILSTTREAYKGYYYKVSTGKYFSGKNPNQPPNIELIPNDLIILQSQPQLNPSLEITTEPEFEYITPISPVIRSLPQFNPNPPTTKEKTNGQFPRYFCKRNNELKYMEINLDTYTQLSSRDPRIAWDLYTPASVLWQIQGDKNTVYVSNQASVYSIEKKLQWHGFSQYFQGQFLKYYLGS
jgi:hypothetical protein